MSEQPTRNDAQIQLLPGRQNQPEIVRILGTIPCFDSASYWPFRAPAIGTGVVVAPGRMITAAENLDLRNLCINTSARDRLVCRLLAGEPPIGLPYVGALYEPGDIKFSVLSFTGEVPHCELAKTSAHIKIGSKVFVTGYWDPGYWRRWSKPLLQFKLEALVLDHSNGVIIIDYPRFDYATGAAMSDESGELVGLCTHGARLGNGRFMAATEVEAIRPMLDQYLPKAA